MFQRAWEFVFGLIVEDVVFLPLLKAAFFVTPRCSAPQLRGCRQSWEVLDETHSAMNSLDLPSTQDSSGK